MRVCERASVRGCERVSVERECDCEREFERKYKFDQNLSKRADIMEF